jgi:hypothetical protein
MLCWPDNRLSLQPTWLNWLWDLASPAQVLSTRLPSFKSPFPQLFVIHLPYLTKGMQTSTSGHWGTYLRSRGLCNSPSKHLKKEVLWFWHDLFPNSSWFGSLVFSVAMLRSGAGLEVWLKWKITCLASLRPWFKLQQKQRVQTHCRCLELKTALGCPTQEAANYSVYLRVLSYIWEPSTHG